MFLSEESLQRLIHLNKPKYDVTLVEASVDERPAIYAQRRKERHALNRIIWLFPQMLHLLPTETMPVSLADCGRFAAQAPQLVWILQSRWMLDSIHLYHPYRRTSLYQIRLLLDRIYHGMISRLLFPLCAHSSPEEKLKNKLLPTQSLSLLFLWNSILPAAH
jgi:hypothetical protein